MPPETLRLPRTVNANVPGEFAANRNSRVDVLMIDKLPLMLVRPPPQFTKPPGSLVKSTVRFPKPTLEGPVVLEFFRITVLNASKDSVPPNTVEP